MRGRKITPYTLTIIKKSIKNINIKIKSSDQVIVTAPTIMPKFMIDGFIKKNSTWIDKKLKNFPKKTVHNFLDGEKFFYLGHKYTLILTNSDTISIDDKNLFIPSHFEDKQEKLDKWYKQKAIELFAKIINKYELLLDKKVSIIRVRKMTTRWGSCNTKKAYINLNLELIKQPLSAIEYVILHELSHLTHPNHSKEFYEYIATFMPDFRLRQKGLMPI